MIKQTFCCEGMTAKGGNCNYAITEMVESSSTDYGFIVRYCPQCEKVNTFRKQQAIKAEKGAIPKERG